MLKLAFKKFKSIFKEFIGIYKLLKMLKIPFKKFKSISKEYINS